MEKRQVGILLFDEVEVLDFAGPFEVFSLARDFNQGALFQVHTITENGQMIRARNGLKVLPDYNFSNCPHLDILLVPRGYGAEEIEIYNESLSLGLLRRLNKSRFWHQCVRERYC